MGQKGQFGIHWREVDHESTRANGPHFGQNVWQFADVFDGCLGRSIFYSIHTPIRGKGEIRSKSYFFRKASFRTSWISWMAYCVGLTNNTLNVAYFPNFSSKSCGEI
jgi:hypothetical protein